MYHYIVVTNDGVFFLNDTNFKTFVMALKKENVVAIHVFIDGKYDCDINKELYFG